MRESYLRNIRFYSYNGEMPEGGIVGGGGGGNDIVSIRTADLWYWKWLLPQLSHNHCPLTFYSTLNEIMISLSQDWRESR